MKKLSLLILVVGLLATCSKEKGPNQLSGSWFKVCDFFPGMKYRYKPLNFISNDTLIYGLGDFMSYEEFILNDLWIYCKNGWKKIENFPGEKRTNAIIFSLDSYIYAGLGENFYISDIPSGSSRVETYRDIWRYDHQSHSWDSLAFEFSGKNREGALLFRLGETIYFGAGMSSSEEFLNEMYTFNPTKGWSKAIPEFVDRQAYATTFEVNGEIYSCFGKDDKEYLRTIRKFDVAQKKWETVYALTDDEIYNAVARTDGKAFVLDRNGGHSVYIVGGKPMPGVSIDKFWACCRYDMETNEIVKINAPQVKEVEAAFTIENEGYIFDSENIWKFTP